ncbi:MAG: ABC transporter substrate-binding protein [Thermoplasmata archaeon]
MKKILVLAMLAVLIFMGFSTPAIGGEEGISVVDARGIEVTLDSPPERIVSYMPSNTEILFHIGVGDLVVGVDDHSNYPPEVDNLPKVGDLEPDIEHILYLEPDLVVTAFYNNQLIESMEYHGIPVFATGATTYDDIFEDMRMLGHICGISETAEQMASQLEDEFHEETKDTRNVPYDERPSVLYITGTWEGINTVGNGTFIHTLLDNAGFENIAADKAGWLTYNEEEVVAQDPDVIITTEGMKGVLSDFIEKDSWQGVTAVELDQVYYVEDDLVSRPGPRAIEGQENLVELAEGSESGYDEQEDVPGFALVLALSALIAAAYVKRRK